MATVAELERYVLSPPDSDFRCEFHPGNECGCQDGKQFQLDEDNMVVNALGEDAYNPPSNYARFHDFLPVGDLKNKMQVLCRDEDGKHVFRKVRWREFIQPCEMFPTGAWELGFSPIVLYGDQKDVAVVLPAEMVIVKKS